MMITSLSAQRRAFPQWGDLGNTVSPLRSVGTGGSSFQATSDDLTTLLVPHLAVIRPLDDLDVTTAWAFDIPTVRAADAAITDLDSQYWVYLQTHP